MHLYNNSEKMEYNVDILLAESQEKVVNSFFLPSKLLVSIDFARIIKMPIKTFFMHLGEKKEFKEKENFMLIADNKEYELDVDFAEIVRLGR